jgi:hypothetical protein
VEHADHDNPAIETLAFDPEQARETLRQLPTAAAVFALYGAEVHDEPYIGRTPNLRGRLERLLLPSDKHPRRLQLASRVRRIQWRLTGSDFESLLLQFQLLQQVYGEKALERMHLRAPAFLRFFGSNRYPRLAVTNRPSQREAEWAYGPFASRVAAERFADETLKLFELRRCTEDLEPDPSHPGCVYSEMKKCLAPCFQGCTDERYAEEAAAVERFLATRGESSLVELRSQRERASEDLEFEQAARIHAHIQRVESVQALAEPLVQPMNQQRALILQASAEPDAVAVFLFERGRLRGPAAFSTLGMRIQNEQSGSTSLYLAPMALVPVPEEQGRGTRDEGPGTEVQGLGIRDEGQETTITASSNCSAAVPAPPPAPKLARNLLDARLEALLATLAAQPDPNTTERLAHLALVKRWYYRPEVRRVGEIYFPGEDGDWPTRAILRGIGRVAAKSLILAPPPAGNA